MAYPGVELFKSGYMFRDVKQDGNGRLYALIEARNKREMKKMGKPTKIELRSGGSKPKFVGGEWMAPEDPDEDEDEGEGEETPEKPDEDDEEEDDLFGGDDDDD